MHCLSNERYLCIRRCLDMGPNVSLCIRELCAELREVLHRSSGRRRRGAGGVYSEWVPDEEEAVDGVVEESGRAGSGAGRQHQVGTELVEIELRADAVADRVSEGERVSVSEPAPVVASAPALRGTPSDRRRGAGASELV